MKELKQYKAKYQKIRTLEDEFDAEDLEDAKGIAELKRPEGYETIHVSETVKSITDPFFKVIGEICNPKNNTYYCDGCNSDIPMPEVEWRNDTPICPKCESKIKL